ncbi:group II truncated hemoglobin [Bdellovibrio sp. HCB337]|uniref:group II truncated hemoglobin n=1 Tax=Bdellovibrio sp. HCB337 TaxID=3394358 RepID=UPI0039A6951B
MDEAKAYDLIGGEEVLRKIVHRFYEVMDTFEQYKELRSIHAESLKDAEEKLFMFLSGWLGGPNLFMEKYGHPRLRARHLPFKIGKTERDQWVLCMVQAFDDVKIAEPLRSELLHSLLKLADHMRNIQETEP